MINNLNNSHGQVGNASNPSMPIYIIICNLSCLNLLVFFFATSASQSFSSRLKIFLGGKCTKPMV